MKKMKLNIQRFASGTVSLGTSGSLAGQIVWSSSSNGTAANSSTMNASLQIRRTDSYTTTGTFKYGWRVGGANTENVSWYGTIGSSWVTITTHSGTVAHNSDGTGSCYISGWVTGPSGTSLANKTVSGNATVTLDKIARQASITSVSDFTDEGNPVLNYNNPAGNSVSSLQACITNSSGNTTYAAYRDVSKTGSSYTFSLTTTERNALRNATPNSNTLTVKFYLKTVISGTTYYSSVSKTMTITNANPTFSNFTFADVNSTTTALTGNNQYNINGYSKIRATITSANKATANKGASMSKYRFAIGNSSTDISYSSSATVTGDISNAPNGTYNVYAIDSRNNSTLVTKLASRVINYTAIAFTTSSCKVERNNGGVGSNAILTYSGTFWNGNFGAVTNSIKSVKYEFKKTSSSTWVTGTTSITPTISGNTFSFSGQVRSNESGYTFALNSSYDFRITITDKLSTKTITLTPMSSGIPNLSLADDGVGIMCDYDENLGGNLQVGGFRAFEYLGYISDVLETSSEYKVGFGRYGSSTSNIPSYINHYGTAIYLPLGDSNKGYQVVLIGNSNNSSTIYQHKMAINSYVNNSWVGWRYIDNFDSYSTSQETMVGTWTNNKPIYRKVIQTTTTAGENRISRSTLSSNIETFTKIDGYTIQPNTGIVVPISYYNNSADWANYYIRTDYIVLRTGSNYGFGSTYITFEYTKTTD